MVKRIRFFALRGMVLMVMLLHLQLDAQNITRPPVWGIAKMTYLVSDLQLTQSYFGDFLGFEHAFSYPSGQGKVVSYKVNDRQFLEFIEDENARNKNRLVSVSFETDELQKMKEFLHDKGIEITTDIHVDGAGNQVFIVHDPSGVPIEYIQFDNQSLHSRSKGKYLSEKRISKRIHHVGLYTEQVKKNDRFYKEILGFKEMWRMDENDEATTNFIYLHMPECVENIEYYVATDQNVSHPCFLVDDMQETIYTLKERKGEHKLANPMIGKGRRWLLNLRNTDGIKVEFTEAYTVR
ncbi:MAG: VOC family protein [Mariniphaga sp.]|nr:VOC family protein [Mariniphaga sp.]